MQENGLIKLVSDTDDWSGALPERPGPERLRAIRKSLTLAYKNTETSYRTGSAGKKLRAQVLKKFADRVWPRTSVPKELRERSTLE